MIDDPVTTTCNKDVNMDQSGEKLCNFKRGICQVHLRMKNVCKARNNGRGGPEFDTQIGQYLTGWYNVNRMSGSLQITQSLHGGSLEITGRVEDKIESENDIHDTTLFSRLRNLSFRGENSMNDSTLFSRVRNMSFGGENSMNDSTLFSRVRNLSFRSPRDSTNRTPIR